VVVKESEGSVRLDGMQEDLRSSSSSSSAETCWRRMMGSVFPRTALQRQRCSSLALASAMAKQI
jgi:hypothetical protein